MLTRIRNLWRQSAIEIPAEPKKTFTERYKEKLQGRKLATILEDSPMEQFPAHEETI